MRGIKTVLTVGLLAASLAAPAMAQRHDRGGDRGGYGGGYGGGAQIEGLSVDAAKNTLRSNGYAPARSIRIDGRQWDLWWGSRGCTGFASYNGRVTNSQRFNDSECGRDGGWGDDRGWSVRDNDRGWNDRDWNDRGRDGRGGRGGRIDARDIVGLSVDEGKRALSYSGFEPAVGTTIRGQRWDFWRSGSSCIGFTSYYGRITDAQRSSGDRCYR